MANSLPTVTVVTINPRSDRPVYRQVADILRDQITTGSLAQGAMLPSEKQLADRYGVGRDAVRQAIAALRAEGIVRTARGEGTRVREAVERKSLTLPPGAQAIARMPTDQERADLRLDEGVPVLAILMPDGNEEVHSGDEVYLMSA